VQLAVRGWVAFGEEVILGWLSEPDAPLDRSGLVDLLCDSLEALVTSSSERPGKLPDRSPERPAGPAGSDTSAL
jgi:hypothetical protein